jgi:hypothetical protein
MLRTQHARGERPVARTYSGVVVAGVSIGFFLVACQGPDEYFRGQENGGPAGSSVSGAAGSSSSGAAGSNAVGTAGNGTGGSLTPTGTAGSASTGSGGAAGSAGATGMAGRGGVTGTGGSVGRGGATGTAGAAGTGGAGRGGTTGTAGAAGTGGMARGGSTGTAGRGGSTGTAGRGGTTGTAGASGRGGRGGSTGTAGATGSCSTTARLDCTAAGALDLTPDGAVVDFSANQWNATTSTWCDADGLAGGIYEFAGTGSTAMAAVDTTARNLKLSLTVSAGQYAGGGVIFHSCVDARMFNSVQFTASVTGGSLNGCALQVQLATQDQYPTTGTNPSGGTCAGAATNCKRYPAVALATAPTATATTFTERFTAFNNPAGSTVPAASQVVGLQWQANSSNGSGTCTVELRIDNAKFVTQ